MCDFHSCIVRRDGAVGHLPTNSHSGAAEALKWRENEPNKKPNFVEVEWNGRGEYPGADKIARVPDGEELTPAQRKAIDRHYKALALVLADPVKYAAKLKGAGIFSGPEYFDVRMEVIRLTACPALVRSVERIAEKFGVESYPMLDALIPSIAEATNDRDAYVARGYVFADHACRVTLPAVLDAIKRPEEAAKLRALNRVTDRAACLASSAVARSVRDILWAGAYAADAAAAYAAYADAADAAYAAAADAAAAAADAADAARSRFLEIAIDGLKAAIALKK